MLPRLRSGLKMIFRRSHWEREMNEELRFHIENRAQELARSGAPHAEALRQARVEFGGLESYKERCREASGATWIDELTRNLRYTGRSIRKRPGFAVVAVFSLALGIGANVAVFSLLKNLILSPLPVRDPKGLHLVVLSTSRGPLRVLSYAMVERLRDNFDIFSDVLGWGGGPRQVAVGDRTENANVSYVTGTYFVSLGVQPALGRLIIPDDDAGTGLEVAVLSDHTWHSLFAGDPGVVSRTLKIGTHPYRIIGVAPPEFVGTNRTSPPDIYIPMQAAARHFAPWIRLPGAMGIWTMVRLKPGVSELAAQNILREGWPRFSPPRRNGDRSRPEYTMLEDGSAGYSAARNEFSAAVVALMGLVAVVLLIACANLATLLLVRSAAQTGEMSIRRALGASRAQLIRQWLTECLAIALVGGLAGLLTAASITKALLYFVPERDRSYLNFHADGAMLLFTAALTLAAGVFFGLLPALRASKVDPGPALCRASRSVTARGQLSEWLLAAQLAACLVLVTGAVLFSRTLWNLNTSAIGFDRKSVVYANPHQSDFMRAGYSQVQIGAAMQQIVETIARSPHIASVSMGLPPILIDLTLSGFALVPGYNYADGEDNAVYFGVVAPRYFETLSIPIIAGRDFNEHDRTPASGHPMIVNESFVRHYFQGRNPLGQSVTITNSFGGPGISPFPREIIGIVKDSKRDNLREAQKDLAYFPLPSDGWNVIVARARPGVAPSTCETEVRSAFASIATNVPIDTGLLEKVVLRSLGRDRLVSELSAAFGLTGVILAAIGLYGAMAHSVRSRTREISIRLALGASPRAVKWMVLRRTVLIVTVGALAGLPAVVLATRAIQALLFGVSPTDPLALSVSAGLLIVAGLLAGWWPAERAARLDPSHALRYD